MGQKEFFAWKDHYFEETKKNVQAVTCLALRVYVDSVDTGVKWNGHFHIGSLHTTNTIIKIF